MQLEPGMRVRCVDAGGNWNIANGIEYRINVSYLGGIDVELNGIPGIVYSGHRFKPIVRVKAATVPA